MQSVLVIKIGAIGDVLRTSYLINALNKNKNYHVTWVTSAESTAILANNPFINDILIFNKHTLPSHVDILICLEDMTDYVASVSGITASKRIGSYINTNGELDYTENVSEWYDMGTISKHGIEVANTLKKENKKSFNEIFSKSLSIDINDIQPKVFFEEKNKNISSIDNSTFRIGLNLFAGNRWPSKQLSEDDTKKLIDSMLQYLQNKNKNKNKNYSLLFFCDDNTVEKAAYITKGKNVTILNTNSSVSEFSYFIGKCDLFVTTDSLGMHLAIANNIRHIAFFHPTSAVEIDNYNNGIKVISQSSDYCSYKPYAKYDKLLWKNIFNQWIKEVEKFMLLNK